jgi:hypothetical protein
VAARRWGGKADEAADKVADEAADETADEAADEAAESGSHPLEASPCSRASRMVVTESVLVTISLNCFVSDTATKYRLILLGILLVIMLD